MAISGEEQLLVLATDLEKAGTGIRVLGRGVVTKGALNVKNDARSRVDRKWWHQVSRTINFDVTDTGAAITAEIGADRRYGAGHLANILEYGTPRHPPTPFLGPAISAEEPRFHAAAEQIALKGLW